MALSPGKLRHAVTIQERKALRDSFGAPVDSWQTVWENIPASIQPLSAREFIASGQLQSAIIARITIRYRPGVTAAMRIVHRDKIYNIAGVLPDLNSGLEYLTLPVTEGSNTG